MKPWLAVLSRELRLALRHPGDALAAMLFFLVVCSLFPFGVGPSPEALARLAPGALVAAGLLAALLPLEAALADLPQMQATEQGATRILNGNPGQVLGHADYGTEVWVSRQGRPLCIGRYLGGEVQPVRVFNLG